MASSEIELPLTGGLTRGVVRIGDRVRRPPTPNSPFMHAVLRHLEAVGFEAAPRSLGCDEAGRDLVSYIEGEVPADLGWHDETTLMAAARLIRRYHDATAGLFETVAARAAGLEVACHNDLSPCNFVFRRGRPVAIIDFEAVAPGPRRHDLGYAAWMWLDLGNDDVEAKVQRERLARFIAAYDRSLAPADVVEAALTRQHILIAQADGMGNDAMARWATACRDWTLRHLSAL